MKLCTICYDGLVEDILAMIEYLEYLLHYGMLILDTEKLCNWEKGKRWTIEFTNWEKSRISLK